MRQIKIIYNKDPVALEKAINEFIHDKEVVCINFTEICVPCGDAQGMGGDTFMTAYIQYEVKA